MFASRTKADARLRIGLCLCMITSPLDYLRFEANRDALVLPTGLRQRGTFSFFVFRVVRSRSEQRETPLNGRSALPKAKALRRRESKTETINRISYEGFCL